MATNNCFERFTQSVVWINQAFLPRSVGGFFTVMNGWEILRLFNPFIFTAPVVQPY